MRIEAARLYRDGSVEHIDPYRLGSIGFEVEKENQSVRNLRHGS